MFVSVVEEGSFSAAAEKMFISQPAITIAVNQIEDYFDYDLFHRGGSNSRVARLTEDGQVIYKIFIEFISYYNEMIQSIEKNMTGISNKISIFIENNSLSILNSGFFNFLNSGKINEEIEVFVDKRDVMLKEIATKEDSIGITVGDFKNDSVDFIPINLIPIGILSSFGQNEISSWSDIGNESFFVADVDPSLRENIENILKSRGVSMANAVMIDDMAVFAELIANGPFIGITPEFGFSSHKSQLTFTKLEQPSLHLDFGMVIKKGRLNSRIMKNFVSDIRTLTVGREIAA